MSTETNKAVVAQFNKEFIEQGNLDVFNLLIADAVINHASPAGMPNGKDSLLYFLQGIVRTSFSNLKIDIQEQIAENDLVTTRKTISGTHTGELFGIPASNKEVIISLIEIVKIKNGQYIEHWVQSNFGDIIAQVSA